ncbi:trafficking protein particle complex subunit 2-like protein [Mayamaea pseudoterrestris]|nr:trafficking protein particle complex subunit 2-like protein [Mayamaea pseudoterrestris]
MAAIALAILGKKNEPLYLREFQSNHHDSAVTEEELFGLESAADDHQSEAEKCSVKQQFILHAALDRFDQIVSRGQWRKQGDAGTDAMFVGLLCPVEDMRVYGYMTTTQIRILLSVQDNPDQPQHAVDQSIQRLLAQIHKFYVEYTLNPFTELNSTIQSQKFDKNIQQTVNAFNNM